jgi:hypothetical protein
MRYAAIVHNVHIRTDRTTCNTHPRGAGKPAPTLDKEVTMKYLLLLTLTGCSASHPMFQDLKMSLSRTSVRQRLSCSGQYRNVRSDHYEDNQGFCHECGVLLNEDSALDYGFSAESLVKYRQPISFCQLYADGTYEVFTVTEFHRDQTVTAYSQSGMSHGIDLTCPQIFNIIRH